MEVKYLLITMRNQFGLQSIPTPNISRGRTARGCAQGNIYELYFSKMQNKWTLKAKGVLKMWK